MVGGGVISRRAGTLSGDGRLLLCPCGRLVHIYSAVTGESVGSLVGHTAEVTAVVLNPDNDEQVYTCSLDTTVRLWDYRAGEELSRVTAGEPIKHMVIQKELGVAYLSVQMRGGGGRIMLYNLKTRKYSGNAMRTRTAGPLALSPGGALAATIDRHSLLVWRTGTDIYLPLNLTHTKPYTCLAISADDSLIAAGDASGRILIWRAFEHCVPSALRDKQDNTRRAHAPVQPPLTTVHWHANQVGALTFSQDGAYLLSGGAEGVLVLWQLETNRPNFLPRLGGAIIGIHPSPVDPAVYVVRQTDNVVRIINAATMKIEASVLGLRPAPAGLLPPAGVAGGAAALLPAGTAAGVGGGSGGAGVLVVPCENAELQFYDVARDRHLRLLQVAPRNRVQRNEVPTAAAPAGGAAGQVGVGLGLVPGASPPPPFVALVAFSRDGSVMATVDVRPDGGLYGSTEACLKFWDSSSGSGSGSADVDTLPSTSRSGSGSGFTLNTRVDEPHRDVVASLSYHPHRHVAVTTGGSGSDSEFKVWVRERASVGGGASTATAVWRCRSTGGFKGQPLGASAFSPDGSVLAVAAAAKVTLWDAECNILAAVLPAVTPAAAAAATAAPPPSLTQLAFIPGTPFLAAASPACLIVYNLLTAAVHWMLPYGATCISADPSYGLLAAALPVPARRRAAAAPAAPAAGPDSESQPAAAASAASQQPAADAADADGGGGAAAAASAPSTPPGRGPPSHPPHPQQRPPQVDPPSCHVVVIDPRDGTPCYHCHVPGSSHVFLTHVQGPGGGPSQGPSGAAEGSSPLLILRDNRAYSLAALPGATDLGAEPATRATLERDQQLVSALEAAFGRPTGQAAGGAGPMDVDGGASASSAATVGGRPRWADLFDAPSHVLPPPTALAGAFLTLLTTADA